jgi:hypothetical protein
MSEQHRLRAGYRPSIEKGLCSVHAQKWEEEQARLESEDHANYSLVQDLITEAAQLDGHTQALHDLVCSDAATPAHGRAVTGCGGSIICRERQWSFHFQTITVSFSDD